MSAFSVCEGHPGRVCDLVADAVLDACLKDDEMARVSCECCTKTGMIMIFGEVSTCATVNYEAVIRSTLKEIGYDDPSKGLDYKTVNVIVAIEEQSPDIARAVDPGAGDSCAAYGYATDETEELMPLPCVLAKKLTERLSSVRKSKVLDWLQPDGKVQVTCRKQSDEQEARVHSVVVSTQHTESVGQDEIREAIMEHVIKPALPTMYVDDDVIYHVNPSGRFVHGGPHADAGCAGRQIEGYGSYSAFGPSLSGKDATKIERAGAYGARWAAKSLVSAKLCRKCQVVVTYAIGIAHPLSITVDSFGTCIDDKTDAELADVVKANFDLRPTPLIKALKLRRPIFFATTTQAHFGKLQHEQDLDDFPWEKPKFLNL